MSTDPSSTAARKPTDPRPAFNIVEPTEENVSRAISIISAAFTKTPLFVAFFGELNGFTPATPHSAIDRSICQNYYTDGLTRLCTQGGVLVESGNFSAVAIWEPPNYRAKDFTSGRKEWGPAAIEWTGKVKAARIQHLGLEGQNLPLDEVNHLSETKLRSFWHLGFLARDPDVESVPGAVSAVVLPFLEKAREEGVPAWLEATSLSGVAMYEHYGFRLVETIVVQEGPIGIDGWPREGGVGGEGARGYCMIYDSHLR